MANQISKSIEAQLLKFILQRPSRPKEPSIDYVFDEAVAMLGENATPADFSRVIDEIEAKKPDQFMGRADGKPASKLLSASDRLEKANLDAAAKYRPDAAPARIEMSDKERAKVERMTLDQRHSFANEKIAMGRKK